MLHTSPPNVPQGLDGAVKDHAALSYVYRLGPPQQFPLFKEAPHLLNTEPFAFSITLRQVNTRLPFRIGYMIQSPGFESTASARLVSGAGAIGIMEP